MIRRSLAIALLLGPLFGCGSGSGGAADAGGDAGPADASIPPTSFVRFDPGDPGTALAFGAVPYPSGLYRDAAGHPRLQGLDLGAGAAPGLEDAILDAFGESDGFGLHTALFLYVDGPVDPATIDRAARLIDLDGNGADIPLESFYWEEKGYVALIPAPGAQMREARRYAFYLTDAARSPDGAPLGASADFIAVRDAGSRPGDARLGAAWDSLAPLWNRLDADGVPRTWVVGAGVFSTQTIGAEMAAIRDQIYQAPAPTPTAGQTFDGSALDDLCGMPLVSQPGFDNPGGVIHANIRTVVHGTVSIPSYLAAQDGTQGIFQTDGAGEPQKQGDVVVGYTLALPLGGDFANLAAVIYVHGVQNIRAKLFSVADGLAARGYAVIAIDLPFHGSRNPAAGDSVHDITGAPGPDGFGDQEQDLSVAFFFGIGTTPPLVTLDPRIARDSMRQSSVDLISLTRALLDGDWSAVATAAGLAQLSFRPDRLALVAQSFGSFMSVGALAVEDRIGGAVLAVAGGGLGTWTLPNSAGYAPLFLPLATQNLGVGGDIDVTTVAERPPRFHPVFTIFQTVVEKGDPLSFAHLVLSDPAYRADAPINLLQLGADQDELVPNRANEAIAGAFGLDLCTMSDTNADPRFGTFTPTPLPISDNLRFLAGTATGCYVIYGPATHGMLTDLDSPRRVEDDFPPFVDLPQSVLVQNPIVEVHQQVVDFVDSYVTDGSGVATVVDPFAN